MPSQRQSLVLCLLLAAIFASAPAFADGWGFDGKTQATTAQDTVEVLSGAWDAPRRGGASAAVTVVVFSDFECPYCERASSALAELHERYGERIAVVHRNLPLDFHPHARAAALAGWAAHQQGAFWAFHDALYAESELSEAAIDRAGSLAGLDRDLFATDRASAAATEAVDRDIAWARELEVGGTPTIFVNGRVATGTKSGSSLTELIDEEFVRAAQLAARGESEGLSFALTRFNATEAGGALSARAESSARFELAPVDEARIEGKADAAVTIVAFAGYSDPGVATLDASVRALQRLYGNEVRVAWRALPRALSEGDAVLGALPGVASERATAEGADPASAARAVHTCLVELARAETLPVCTAALALASGCADERAAFEAAAVEALDGCGLPGAALVEAVTPAHETAVVEDRALARSLGVRRPQALFVNGYRFDAAPGLDVAVEVADAGLDRGRALRDLVDVDALYPLLASPALAAERETISSLGRSAVGPVDAQIKIVEFVDLECPYCGRGHQTLDRLVDAYGDQIRIATVHTPLAFHENADLAARVVWSVAQLAGDERARELMATIHGTDDLDGDRLLALGAAAGVERALLEATVESAEASTAIADDKALSKRAGVRGTPAYFVNGRRIDGAKPYDVFAATVEQEIELAALVPDGVSLDELRAALPEPEVVAEEDARVWVDVGGRPSRGGDDALVTIVEFSDFQCPFCARVQPTLDTLADEYGDDVRRVFVHNPLDFHEEAEPAARAAWAAERQGEFDAYAAALFAESRTLSVNRLPALADELGLDVERFATDMASDAAAAAVAADRELARVAGVTGTPAFLLNGTRLVGAQPADAFRETIDAELARAQALLDDGVSKRDLYAVASGGLAVGKRADVPRVKTRSLPRAGKRKADHQVVLYADPTNPAAAVAFERIGALAALAEREPDLVEVVWVPLTPTETAREVAAAGLARDDVAEGAAVALEWLRQERAAPTDRLRIAAGEDAVNATESRAVSRALEDAAKAVGDDVLGGPTFVIDGKLTRGPRAADEIARALGAL